MIRELSQDELLDWLAYWEIEPWDGRRDDVRAAVASLWQRGESFTDFPIEYPHTQPDETDDIIALLEQDAEDGQHTLPQASESTGHDGQGSHEPTGGTPGGRDESPVSSGSIGL